MISTERASAGPKRWSDSSRSRSARPLREAFEHRGGKATLVCRTSSGSAGKARGLERLPRERLVDLARQSTDADGNPPVSRLERGEPAEEKREERVEARALDSVLAHLVASSLVERASLRAAVYAFRCAFRRVSVPHRPWSRAMSSPCVSAMKTETGLGASRTTKARIRRARRAMSTRIEMN